MLNQKMNNVINEVSDSLAEREELVYTIALALLTGKNLFVLGKPGQAKSQAIDMFRSRIRGAKQFDVLMSKGIDQEQLFGRLDLASIIPGHIPHSLLKRDAGYTAMSKELDELLSDNETGADAFTRSLELQQKMESYRKCLAELHGGSPEIITENKIPESHICFLDEIFKANDGVLNSLLKALNERTYTNEGVTVAIPVISFFSASNEIPNFNNPEEQSLRALYDRFDFKVHTEYVESKDNRMKVLNRKQAGKDTPVNSYITLDELYLMQGEIKTVAIPDGINELADNILCELRRKGIAVSDRTYFNFGPIVQASAWLRGDNTVKPEDMNALVNYLWDKPEQREVVRTAIKRLTENPLGDEIKKQLANAYECKKRFDTEGDKNQALLIFRNEIVAVFDSLIALKEGLDDADPTVSSIDNAVSTLEDISRSVHSETSFTYLPLSELKCMQNYKI